MNRLIFAATYLLVILTSCDSTKAPAEPKKFSNSHSLEVYDSLISMTANIYLISTQQPEQDSMFYSGAMTKTGLDSNRIKEKVALEREDWIKLKKVLYHDEDDGMVAACYTPHHGIAYYNDSEELIAYLEIYLSCHRMTPFNNFPSLPNQPSELFHGLRIFFESKGLLGRY